MRGECAGVLVVDGELIEFRWIDECGSWYGGRSANRGDCAVRREVNAGCSRDGDNSKFWAACDAAWSNPALGFADEEGRSV